MYRTCLAVLLSVSAASAGAAETCRPIAGLEPLIRPGAVLLLGEIHGTAESPAFVGDVACRVARAGLPVVVALELPVEGEERVDAFLRSDGGEEDRRALLAGPAWQASYQDGRTSAAMLELIERVRRLRREGARARIVLFDPGASGGGQARDRGMADRLADLVSAETKAVTVVLTGNLHSRTSRGFPGRADYEPMGYLLAGAVPGGRIVALDQAHGGGTAWICAPQCGVARLGGRRSERPWEIEIGGDPPSGHDGWYRIGSITASPPARLSPAERASPRLDPARPAGEKSSPDREPARAEPQAPAPPEPGGPLSAAEKSVQGSWQGYDFRRGFETWSLEVDGRGFRAEGSGDWYEGRLVVRGDRTPAWIDFVIERCRCAYEGDTSQAVFGWDGDSLVVAASPPAKPRPADLEARGAQLLRFVRR